MTRHAVLVPAETIDHRILLIRRQRVILDVDLALMFGVRTKRLNEQVGRNLDRFPRDFMFRLTRAETLNLRSQIATSSAAHGGRRYRPFAFSEHGAVMAANVVNSPKAVAASVLVVRAFVRLRQLLGTHQELAAKLVELEKRLGTHDQAIGEIMKAIRLLMNPPVEPNRERIGFRAPPKPGPTVSRRRNTRSRALRRAAG